MGSSQGTAAEKVQPCSKQNMQAFQMQGAQRRCVAWFVAVWLMQVVVAKVVVA